MILSSDFATSLNRLSVRVLYQDSIIVSLFIINTFSLGDNGRQWATDFGGCDPLTEQRGTTGDNGRQRETTGDNGGQRETAGDNGRQRETTGDNGRQRIELDRIEMD